MVGWQEVHESLECSPRHHAWYQAARWALDTLQEQLGTGWLERAVSLKGEDDPFPLGLHALSFHAHALAEALEWALRLEMCQGWEGSADFLRDLIKDPNPGRILHSRSQLAQASLAKRLGWNVKLEPATAGGSPADLAITAPSGIVVAEVRVLTPSEFGEDQRTVAEGASDWLFGLRLKYDVWIAGTLGRDPDPEERQEIEQFVNREASRVKDDSGPRYSSTEISLELRRHGSGAPALTGPAIREDLFTRMVRVIADKAKRMEMSGAQWLHVTVLTGLWAFTPWGRGPLQNKATVMSAALAKSLDDSCPEGIVLTSAASLAPDDMQEELAQGSAGFSLRTGVQPLRGRETLIMPLRREARPTAEDWLTLARSESDWLPWALVQRGIPSLTALLNRQQG